MLKINCHIDSNAISCAQNISNKYNLLREISIIAHNAYGLNGSEVLAGMQERETLGSTGFGNAIAIPHCKIDGLDTPLGIFISLSKPIDYDSIDDEPVDLIFAIISPVNNGASHLRALAEVSRLLRDEKSRQQLRGTANADAIFAMLAVNSELTAA